MGKIGMCLCSYMHILLVDMMYFVRYNDTILILAFIGLTNSIIDNIFTCSIFLDHYVSIHVASLSKEARFSDV